MFEKKRTSRTSCGGYCLRILVCALGFFCVSLGVAATATSDLGTSPISSVAWVAHRVSAIAPDLPVVSFGTTSFVLNVIFFLMQWVIQRRNFGLVQFLQLPCTFLFGLSIDFCMLLCSHLPVGNYGVRILLVVAGCMVVAAGLVLEISADVLYLPGDGIVKTLADVFRLKMGIMKASFDVFLTLASVVVSYLAIRQFVGVREGTVIAAFAVGFFLRLFNPLIGKLRAALVPDAPK